MTYKLVIFDFDGTLADSFPWFLSVMNQVAEECGLRTIADHELEELRHMSARQIIKRQRVAPWKLPRAAMRLHELMAADAEQIRPFPGVADLLDQLSDAGLRVALVTSNSEANARLILGESACTRIEHFDCGASVFGKASKFRKTMKRLGATPAQTLCVGDELRDLDAARKVRAAFGAVGWGYTHPDALQAGKPTHYFPTLDDLAQLLLPAGEGRRAQG
ncbi:HAD-IA family hydrolase [Caulobacter sp. 17J80-11]|uniref:HAD-IA family hydrolase n=1 Tax=Caulobacter sp. 17J80-11 TaxID=2763502 RepID=UPI001653D0A3|nr:HAD-IA family hydrolase [Caulobacter sp. 17J80-11]